MCDLNRSKRTGLLSVLSVVIPALLLCITFWATGVRTVRADPDVIYVDADATGVADGTSWTDAYTNVQDALLDAEDGDEIWVAEGAYYPDAGGNETNDDATSTFTLTAGVALYGGFAGGEDSREDRDWEANVSVLSGDLQQDDTGDGDVLTDTDDISGTNAYHVVTGGGVTETAVLDGFVVTAGRADGEDFDGTENGAGMYNQSSHPTLSNLTFSGNWADNEGGGMWNEESHPKVTNATFTGNKAKNGGGMHNDESSPRLMNVTFSDNSASSDGGGLDNDDHNTVTLTNVTFTGNSAQRGGGMDNDHSTAVLTDVVFSGNEANSEGGGLRNRYCETTPTLLINVTFSGNRAAQGGGMHTNVSTVTLTNVSFTGNRAFVPVSPGPSDGRGGGMYNVGKRSILQLTNMIFTGNRAEADGGGMYNSGISPTLTNVTFGGNLADDYGGGLCDRYSSNPTLVNCILWGNEAATGTQIFNGQGSTLSISNSDIKGSGGSGAGWDALLGNDGGNNVDANPLFVAPVAAGFAPTTTGDYRLRAGSPAIDVGNNLSVTVGTDLDGNPRIVDGDGDGDDVVDMGAYEFQGAAPVGGVTVGYAMGAWLERAAATLGLVALLLCGTAVVRRQRP